jgi:hypothetical protein
VVGDVAEGKVNIQNIVASTHAQKLAAERLAGMLF